MSKSSTEKVRLSDAHVLIYNKNVINTNTYFNMHQPQTNFSNT